MREEKAKYIREFLICCLESSTLDEYYNYHIGIFIKDFKSLYTITMYFIRKQIIICYNKDTLLSINEAEKFLSSEENWKDIPNYNELVLIEDSGFDYYNNKRYYEEIDNGIFPNFEVVTKGNLDRAQILGQRVRRKAKL